MSKKTIVIGSSENPERYSYIAVMKLHNFGHEVVPVGVKAGKIGPYEILTGKPAVTGVDTVSLYVGPKNQAEWYDYVLGLNPKRIIFNPGTENPEFEKRAQEKGIEALEACTLVMLSVGTY
ncbi:MAG: hypothetical protein FD123_686 [Bacteroidetes bacterium]|nr:MAG: hypothetical protein FD123_686 [Bacteroidota bacterium]